MPDLTRAERVAHAVALHVAEIPDRFSPEDQPEMMLVTRDELIAFIVAEMPPDPQPQTGALRELREWIVKQAGNMSPLNDDEWSRAAVQVTQAILGEIDRLLAAPAPAEPGCVTAMRELHRQAAPYRGGGTQACDAWMSKAQDLMRDVVDHSAAGEPAPAEPEPVADAERERRVAGGDGYRALDHAMEILGSCVHPYTGEQAQKVAKVLRQWSDKWAAAVDCIYPDERQALRDRDAEVARLREEVDVAKRDRSIRDSMADGKRIASLNADVERLTKERDDANDAAAKWDAELRRQLRDLRAELDRARGGWEALERLRDEITRREEANQKNFKAGISPCKDSAVLLGCTLANQDTIERIGDLLAARPAQGKEEA